jgi:hypothetical protein
MTEDAEHAELAERAENTKRVGEQLRFWYLRGVRNLRGLRVVSETPASGGA